MAKDSTNDLTSFEQGKKVLVLNFVLLSAIGLILALQLHIQFVQKINWDEFYFLSLVYDYERGELSKPLQTAHVHFFGWLKYVSPNEVKQIIAARVVMWVVQLGMLYFIFKSAREFMSRSSALFAVLSFLGFGFIFLHGTSFRADPIAACLVSAAIYIFTATSLEVKNLAALSVILAMSLLVTIKVIFFAPLFVVLALWRLSVETNRKPLFIRLIVCAAVSIILFALGYLGQLSLMPSADITGSKDMLENAGKTTLLGSGLFPRSVIIQQHFILGSISAFMLILGFVFILLDFTKGSADLKRVAAVLAMGLPVLSLIFYRNAFPYYFTFIFPTIILWAGFAAEKLKKMQALLVVLALANVINIALQYKYRLDESNQIQYKTLKELHRIFPETVNYIDRSAMMSSHNKAGFFMSSWGIQNYRAKRKPVLAETMKIEIIPALIDNSPEINRALYPSNTPSLLLPQDQLVLRENYILHWGHIWIAGRTLNVSTNEVGFQNLVPGKYRLESQYPIILDASSYFPGDIINLSRGQHSVISDLQQVITLRWGENIQAPDIPAPSQPIFTNF